MEVALVDRQINAAEGVHQVLKSFEADINKMVDADAGVVANGSDQECVTAFRVGGVDLFHPIPGNIHIEVAGQRKQRNGIGAGIDVSENDGVGVASSAGVARVVACVVTDQKKVVEPLSSGSCLGGMIANCGRAASTIRRLLPA